MNPLIALDAVSKRFGALVAVDGLSLTVRRGEVLGFLGPNGAGKTTTMRMIAGYLEPSAGTIRVSGLDVGADPIAVKHRIGYLPEGAPIYGDMTTAAFLDFIAEVRGYRGADRRRRIDAVIDKVALDTVLDRPVETLSKGFKRRVGLAQAILHDPEVLILDEPTDGLDPNQKRHVRDLIRDMAAEKAIIVSTHILDEVDACCTRAVIIDRGRIVADGSAEDLRARLPHHNAALVTVPTADAAVARDALAALGGGAIEEAAIENGAVTLRVPPAGGVSPTVEVARRLASAGVRIEALAVERGRLDDVFHRLTAEGGADG